jgi:capsular polysaccharide transport system permease protein
LPTSRLAEYIALTRRRGDQFDRGVRLLRFACALEKWSQWMSVSSARSEVSLATHAAAQWRVIVALMIREGQANYSQETLGFFWIIGEPLTLTCGVIALWTLMGRGGGHAAVSVVAFALSAYTHIQLWRLGVLSCLAIIKNSAWMFYHPNVHVMDIIFANLLIKSVSIFTSFVVICTVVTLFGIIEPIRDPGLMLAAWGLDTLFVLSFATLMAGLAALNEYVEKITHPLMYLTLPLTGAFTMTDWLPPQFKFVLEWSPLANCIEMFRAGMFSLSLKTYYSVPLILLSSLFLFATGIPIVAYARRQVIG